MFRNGSPYHIWQVFDFGQGASQKEKLADRKDVPDHLLTHWLYFQLVSGHDLLSADSDGYSDPYCDMFVWCPAREHQKCKHMWRSTTKNTTLNPVWKETQRVPMLSENGVLHLVCFDWDKARTHEALMKH